MYSDILSLSFLAHRQLSCPADSQMPVNKSKLRQKDVAARWRKKNTESHSGFKNHSNADQGNKLVQSYAVTDAAVHDSQVFEALLDREPAARKRQEARDLCR